MRLGYGNNSAAAWPQYERQGPGYPISEFPTANLSNFDLCEKNFKDWEIKIWLIV